LLHSMYVMITTGFHCGQRSFFPMNWFFSTGVCVCVALGCCWWRQRWDLRHPSELVQLSPHKVVAKSQNLMWTGWLESFSGCPSLCSRT
jgi:hypothetical protein